jgi:hypothetical protein
MNARKLKRMGIVTAAIVSAAVVASGGVALASASWSTPGTISACYQAGSSPASLQLTSATCPSGDSEISWNQQGAAGPAGPAGAPGATGAQGPAGVPAGVTEAVPWTGNGTALNNQQYTTVFQTPAVTQSGTYYLSGSIVVGIQPGDQVICQVGLANQQFTASNQGAVGAWASIPVTAAISVPAGEDFVVGCYSLTSNGKTDVYSGTLNAVLVGNSTGTLGTYGTQATWSRTFNAAPTKK